MKKFLISLAIGIGVLVSVLVIGFFLHKQSVSRPVEPLPIESVEDSTEETIRYKVPEKPISQTLEGTVKEDTFTYSETSICAVFAPDIRSLCEEAFGEYLGALQMPYAQLLEAGYEYFAAFTTDEDTYAVGDNSLEFTIYLPDARGRFTITKSDENYNSNFRILEDTEYFSSSMVDGVDEEPETVTYTFNTLINPPPVEGYMCIDSDLSNYSYYTFDSDMLADLFTSSVVLPVREVLGDDGALEATASIVVQVYGESVLGEVTLLDTNPITLVCGDHLFVLEKDGDITRTSVYIKDSTISGN